MKTSINKISAVLTLLLLIACSTAQATLTITPSFTPICTGNDGAVTFSVTGGTGGYTYLLYDTRSGSTTQQTSATFTNLHTGDYEIFVFSSTDSNHIVFRQPTIVNGSIATTPALCTQQNGVVTVTGSGGTAPYLYQWNDANNSTTQTLTNGIPGYYYVAYVTDANGCQSDSIMSVMGHSTPISVTITSSGTICNQTLTAVATGGGPSYTYRWSNNSTATSINSISISNIYSVTVSDPNGCSATQSYNVTATAVVVDSLNTTITEPTCGSTNGSIAVGTLTTGTAPYTYQWSTGDITSTVSGLSAGFYSVTVYDANGCMGSKNFYLQSPNQLTSLYICNYSHPTCGASDGGLTACAYAGGAAPSYAWSTGQQTNQIQNIPSGTYTVTASYQGCTLTASIVLAGIANYYVNVTTTPTSCDTSLRTGTATAVISGTGGTPPYTFQWYGAPYPTGPGTAIGRGQTISGLGYGEYVYTDVTDANGCIPNYSFDSASIQLDPACFDHITGYSYNDLNSNCLHDAGDQSIWGATMYATDGVGQTYYATPDSSGFYDISVLPGTYTVMASFYTYGGCNTSTCNTSYTVSFTTIGQTAGGNDFGISSSTPTYDLGVHMGYYGAAPGTQREYWVYYYNWGLQPVANGTLTFVYDPNITLSSTTPPYTTHNAATHTLTWDITNNLAPQQWLNGQHQVIMYFDIPSSLPLGTLLTAHADISPVASDCNPLDNSENLNDVVSASHDPNEKEVSPAGNLSASDTVLTYTVRFQNNGNAPANLIVIKDTLSSNVDPRTVSPGASSAPYDFAVSGNGVLTFTFSNINLPDSSHGDSSTGFVMYTVHVKRNLPIGSVINNTASIYFDANSAIVTNTTSSLRSDLNGISRISGGSMSAQVVPNPARERALIEFSGATGAIDMQITDALGKTILTTTVSDHTYSLDAERLAPGMYFYIAKDANGNKASGKISVIR